MTVRGDILRSAITATEKERQDTYGDPAANLCCAAALKATYRKFSRGKYSPEHDEAIEAALAKISRIATGIFHRDNYVDGPGYIAIAAECEERRKLMAPQEYMAKLREDYLESPNYAGNTSEKNDITDEQNGVCRPFVAQSENWD